MFSLIYLGHPAQDVLSSLFFAQPYCRELYLRVTFLVGNSQKHVGAPDCTKQFVKESV